MFLVTGDVSVNNGEVLKQSQHTYIKCAVALLLPADADQSSSSTPPFTEPTRTNTEKPETSTEKPERVYRFYEARCAGYVLPFEVALKWANRILTRRKSKRVLTTSPSDRGNVLLTLDTAVRDAGGVGCNFVGLHGASGCWENYLIVTSEEFGEFYEVDGEQPPGSEIVDPEGERIGKELLEKEARQIFDVDELMTVVFAVAIILVSHRGKGWVVSVLKCMIIWAKLRLARSLSTESMMDTLCHLSVCHKAHTETELNQADWQLLEQLSLTPNRLDGSCSSSCHKVTETTRECIEDLMTAARVAAKKCRGDVWWMKDWVVIT
ncbi:hypothetical protein K435DRAFT_808994 [Dendrothele bispora CBS 962.96]|uniref:Uncharacterized protein n=1 Tax=Dendrothele bispora (strain CBS 962.96) TaxID=1314807 RepID=A0A4S8KZM8_DENBC|nr:hypothetical protein K435DRAFT_808994 [Dendrothele bispora CBS 962.96]